MKRKVKKFAEGGTNVRTRTDEEFAEDSKYGGYGRYMPKTKEYTVDEVKDKLSGLFGGKSKAKDEEAYDYDSDVKREAIKSVSKAEPKADVEEPRRKISDYSTNKGITNVSEEDAPSKVEKTKLPRSSGSGTGNRSTSNTPSRNTSTTSGRSAREPADNDKLPSKPYPENTKSNDERRNRPNPNDKPESKVADKPAKPKDDDSKVSGPGGRMIEKNVRGFKNTSPEYKSGNSGFPMTDDNAYKIFKSANKANLRAEETEKQSTFKERAEAAKAEADKAEKKAARDEKKAAKDGKPAKAKAKSSSFVGKMPGPKLDFGDPYSATLGSGLDPKTMLREARSRSSGDIERKKTGGQIKKMAKGGSASSRGDGIAMRGKTRGRIY
jgi:hypothetical protein